MKINCSVSHFLYKHKTKNTILFCFRFQLAHILGLVCGVMSVVVILWTDVQDGRGGVTAGGDDRLTGDSLALLSGALSGLMQVAFFWQFIKWFDFLRY